MIELLLEAERAVSFGQLVDGLQQPGQVVGPSRRDAKRILQAEAGAVAHEHTS